MLDEPGQALTAIEPGGIGRVRTHGEIWTATADEPIEAGSPVRVIGVNGLLLRVRTADRRRSRLGLPRMSASRTAARRKRV